MLERARKFPIKQIAAQAGLSKATVDRVLHQRGCSHRTQQRVEQAIAELETQAQSAPAMGRTLYVDVVMHTPQRFSQVVQQAINSQLGSLKPFRLLPRFHLFEHIDTPALCALLRRCVATGSQGLILKAADEAPINAAVDAISEAGIPVITLVTDLPRSQRVAYVGMDNRSAGQTAAYLLSRWLTPTQQTVAVVIGSALFRGEEEREMGFRSWLRQRAPYLDVLEVSGGFGSHAATRQRMSEALAARPDLASVYCVGGGNRAIVEAFAEAGRPLRAFVGHDLDAENRQLLGEERIDAIIDHDLQLDARHAFLHILRFHRLVDQTPLPASQARVVTPFNLPG